VINLARLPWPMPLSILIGLASLGFLGLGVRTFILPEVAAAFFGAPATGAEALVFVKAYGARNIAISLTALTLLMLGERRGLAALLAFAAGVAGLDALTMHGYSGLAGSGKHMAYVALLGALAAAAGLLGHPVRQP
jgi:hypothetical protein